MGTNVSTPFFQVPMLEFRQGHKHKSQKALGLCVDLVLVVLGQSTALYLL